MPDRILGPMEFMRHFGARIGDTLSLKKEAYQDGKITFVTSKGNMCVKAPCAPALKKLIEQGMGAEFLFENNLNGKQWTRSAVDNCLQRVVKRLEKEGKVDPGLTPHGLRHSAGGELRELRLSEREIADFLGQKDVKSVGLYTRDVNMEASNTYAARTLHLSRKRSKVSRKSSSTEGKTSRGAGYVIRDQR